MLNKIDVTNIEIDIVEKVAYVHINDKDNIDKKKIQAEGRMLADSDNKAFIYILDVENNYYYVSFPEGVWQELGVILQNHITVYLRLTNKQEELIQFHEELEFLVSNIFDNSNYGKLMVESVNKIFNT